MSQVNEQREWTSPMDMPVQARNEDLAEAARDAASSSTREAGDLPAVVDLHTGPRKSKPLGAIVDDGVVSKVGPFHPSPSLDPKLIESLDEYEAFGEDLGAVRSCFDTAYKGLVAIDAARQQLRRDPTITEGAAAVKLVAQAERKHQQIFESFPRVTERLNKTIETLERSLRTPVEQQAGLGTVNDAIRAHSKALTVDKRRQFIEEAFVNRDEKTLVALMGSPHYLSGLSKGMHDHYLRQLHEMREPSTVRRIKALREAVVLMERAYPIALAGVEKALGSSFKKAQEFKALSEKSEAALKAIMTPAE